MFPSHIRGFAVGAIATIARLSNCLAPFMEYLSDLFQVHPLFICSLPCFIGFIAARSLPETMNKKLLN